MKFKEARVKLDFQKSLKKDRSARKTTIVKLVFGLEKEVTIPSLSLVSKQCQLLQSFIWWRVDFRWWRDGRKRVHHTQLKVKKSMKTT